MSTKRLAATPVQPSSTAPQSAQLYWEYMLRYFSELQNQILDVKPSLVPEIISSTPSCCSARIVNYWIQRWIVHRWISSSVTPASRRKASSQRRPWFDGCLSCIRWIRELGFFKWPQHGPTLLEIGVPNIFPMLGTLRLLAEHSWMFQNFRWRSISPTDQPTTDMLWVGTRNSARDIQVPFYSISYVGVSINGGGTLKWMVFVREIPTKIWMMTGGTPMTQETSMWLQPPEEVTHQLQILWAPGTRTIDVVQFEVALEILAERLGCPDNLSDHGPGAHGNLPKSTD